MQTINLHIPEALGLSEREVLTAVATRLYDTGKLNITQAAEMAKSDLPSFIEELMGQSLRDNKRAYAFECA